jgi:hypothetical protein
MSPSFNTLRRALPYQRRRHEILSPLSQPTTSNLSPAATVSPPPHPGSFALVHTYLYLRSGHNTMVRQRRHITKSPWTFQPYVVSFTAKVNNTTVVISLACGKLTGTPWGSADMPMRLVPHNFKSSNFPPGLFPIGDYYPKAGVDGKGEEGVTHMNFTQDNGVITRFTWTSKRGKNLHFERITDASLAQPHSPLFRLPGELHNKMYVYTL